jgi:DNA-binding transcriptional regulator of glucitol operon
MVIAAVVIILAAVAVLCVVFVWLDMRRFHRDRLILD